LLSNLGSLAGLVLSLVSEADAIANFEKTLITLNATIGTLDGKWVMRDTKHGDVDAVYEFSANNELAVTEYEDCSDNAIYWAAASASAERNCTSTPLSLNWQLSGKVLTMSNSSISDSCTIISSTPYLMEASCTFTGGEGGIFLFERVITSALSNNLINNSYREVSVGTLSYTTQTFSSDLTGSYRFLDENGITSLDDTGTFTWSTSASQLSFAGTDGASATFSDTIIFEEAVNGAISADVKSRVLIPDFDTNIAAVGINHNTWGIYDAINGNCKKIYNFNTNATPLPLRKFDNTSSNADHCTVPSGGLTLPDSLGGADDYSVLISKGAFVIEKGSEREICWPIKYINISEDSDYIVVACAIGASPFAFEIWRQI
jgi:hypothetical protein